MANKKIDLGVAQTKGTFALFGKITGRYSNNFYSEGVSHSGVAWRKVHFGVEVEPNKVIYVDMFGSVGDTVYFSKSVRGANGKNEVTTKSVPWANRTKTSKQLFGEDGYRIIGITCGCKKTIDKNGKEVNDIKYLSAYDACDEVGNLNDGDSVYVRGNISYSTYEGKHRVSFEPNQVSLMREELDFDSMEFQPYAQFTQPIVAMGVSKNEDNPGEYIVNAMIVNYQSIEETELYVRDLDFAKDIKKLGEYCYFKSYGDIVVDGNIEEVKEKKSSGWGAPNKMDRVASPFVRKLVITGGDGDTIDHEAYSKEKMEHALEIVAGIQRARDDYDKMSGKIDTKKSNWDKKDDISDDPIDLGDDDLV